MKHIIFIVILITWTCVANAQYYEEKLMDSLQRVVDKPDTKDADRIDFLVQLSQLYVSRGFNSIATQMLDRARMLAMREKDGKYMINIYIHELINCQNEYSQNITLAYQIIDSLYTAIKKTSDPEARALAYSYIGWEKCFTNPEYDFNDSFQALSIAETLPEKSMKKYKILGDTYYTMFTKYAYTDSASAKKYLDLMQQTAEKWGDKNFQSRVMSIKLNFDALYSAKDTSIIALDFVVLENFISKNRFNLQSFEYGLAVATLIEVYPCIPNARYLKLLENHIETFKKMDGSNFEIKVQLLDIEWGYAIIRNNYDEAINILHQKIELVKPDFPMLLYECYKRLSLALAKIKKYEQAYEAMDTCLIYLQQYQSAKLDEQHQLAEVKMGVAKQEQLIKNQRNHIFISFITAILVIIIFIMSAWSFNRQKNIEKLEREKTELIAQHAMEENEILGKKLIVSVTELDRKNRFIENVKDMNVEQLGKAIRLELKKTKLTNEYTKLFNEINSEFYKQLQTKAAPHFLSYNDLKYCAYIALRMSNKDIANVMNVEYNTVVSQKYRLKKKFHLSENEDLDEFIVNLPPPLINIYLHLFAIQKVCKLYHQSIYKKQWILSKNTSPV